MFVGSCKFKVIPRACTYIVQVHYKTVGVTTTNVTFLGWDLTSCPNILPKYNKYNVLSQTV